MHIRKLIVAFLLILGANVAYAGCGIESGRVNFIGNEFPAIHTVVKGAMACADDNVSVEANLTVDHLDLQVAGMQGQPAEYTAAFIANSSVVSLMNEDLIRPLDDLLAKHGDGIPANNLIRSDGKVMAVAFMANAQHLVYRKDVLEQIGVEPPTTYEQMLEAAEMIREQGIMEYPLGGTFMAGWNLAQEFVNMYIGYDGEFYKPGTAEVAINNEKGVAALEMMKALSEYMNPDYLTHDSNAAGAEMEAGNMAIMNFWGSRMGKLTDAEGAEEVVYSNLAIGGPLTVGGGSTPATTLWWDGWSIAKNISDEDAEASFLALKNGMNPSILTEETTNQAVWMIEGYEPADVHEGVFATIQMGAQPYPMLPYHGLLHTVLGENLADFLQGKESAQASLADAEAAYTTAAREKGFLN